MPTLINYYNLQSDVRSGQIIPEKMPVLPSMERALRRQGEARLTSVWAACTNAVDSFFQHGIFAIDAVVGGVLFCRPKRIGTGICQALSALAVPITSIVIGVLGLALPTKGLEAAQSIKDSGFALKYIDYTREFNHSCPMMARVYSPIRGVLLGASDLVTGIITIANSFFRKNTLEQIGNGVGSMVNGMEKVGAGFRGIISLDAHSKLSINLIEKPVNTQCGKMVL